MNVVMSHDFVHGGGMLRFCQMWVGAIHQSRGTDFLESLERKNEIINLQQFIDFFENFNMPIIPSNIDEGFVKEQMGL